MKKPSREKDRLDRVEKQVQDIAKDVSRILEMVSEDAGSRLSLNKIPIEPSDLIMSKYSNEKPWVRINPWALQTAMDLSSETYHDTLDALTSTEEGYTAEEVSEKTGRCRNTESGYMHRLYKAGYLKRVKSGKKVMYAIKDREMLNVIFQKE